MVIKKEGATMACKNCDTDLICRTKDYGGTYAPSLQWQNFDGSAHYKTTDGKNFNCNIPEDKELNQTRIPSESATTAATTPGTPPSTITRAEFQILAHVEEEIDVLLTEVDRLKDMVTPLFQKMVDEQIGRVRE